MTINELALDYRERGYTARGETLFAPNGWEVRGTIRSVGMICFPEQLAREIADMQRAEVDSKGRRDLHGLVLTTSPHEF